MALVTIGYLESLLGLVVLVVLGPVVQFVTLRVGVNGMRADVKEVRADVKKLVASDADQHIALALHDQRLGALESRITKIED